MTDAEGVYRFAAVEPGTYSVTANALRLPPQAPGQRGRLRSARSAEIPIVLGVGGLTESVDVVGESPVVDVCLERHRQHALPGHAVQPADPAHQRRDRACSTTCPASTTASAFGTNEDYGNGLLIDGVDTRDPDAGSAWVFFNYNLIEEVQVSGLGANAEYGSYTGAVVNTITKSGGNRYTGLFDAYWTKGSFCSDNVKPEYVDAEPVAGRPVVVDKRLDLTGQLGGPLIKDKLFFFVAAQRYEQKDNPSGPRTLHTEVSPRFNGKLTWQPGPNDNVASSFQWDNYNQTGRVPRSARTPATRTATRSTRTPRRRSGACSGGTSSARRRSPR